MKPPHLLTPDYPRSPLAAYMGKVMALFDQDCEGHRVTQIEQACTKLWDNLSQEEKAIAVARVQILYTLFGQHRAHGDVPYHEAAFESWSKAHQPDQPLGKHVRSHKELARLAWKAGMQFANEDGHRQAQAARARARDYEDACIEMYEVVKSLRDRCETSAKHGALLHPDMLARQLDTVLRQIEQGVLA